MRIRLARCLIVAVACFAHASVAGAHSGSHRTTLSDVEDEVMCPACGTTLQLSSSPLADRQRALISRLVEQNRTKEQIKQALVREFGQEVLASPPDRGFGLSAYAVPLVVLAVTAVALPFALHRWRREKSSPDDEPLIELSDSDADRLDRELELMRRRDD